jgi:hypothetical protein
VQARHHAEVPPSAALRLRSTEPALIGLPWGMPLEDWPAEETGLRELPVGPSRHVVRFLATETGLIALKELPPRIARREYDALRRMHASALPVVRPLAVVEPPGAEAVLATEYLRGAFQFRRTLMRLALDQAAHRARLLDAIAGLLVELHAGGAYWGDCSLANTLFRRDGQRLPAFLVDAETTEIHPQLTDGQRRSDLGILVDNVTGDLANLAAYRGEEIDVDGALAEAERIAASYRALWDEVMREEPVAADDRHAVEQRIRRLNDLGFSVDELELVPAADGTRSLRLRVAIAGRRFHARRLQELTGLEVGEGQAAILLNDLHAFRAARGIADPGTAGMRWRAEQLGALLEPAHAALGDTDPVQAYCDLLEVRWLLSERAGRDVGDAAALAALAERRAPLDSAAALIEAEQRPGPAVDETDPSMPALTDLGEP